MSSVVPRAPLALSSDGVVLLNAATFDVPKNAEQLFELAVQQRGAIFIGIAVSPRELDRLRVELDDAMLQAAFMLAGTRQARQRRKHKKSHAA